MEEIKLTKRKLLRNIAKIYNPIGLPAALTIRAKIGIQELWRMGFDWNDELPLQVKAKWVQLLDEMQELSNVTFERCLLTARAAKLSLTCVFSNVSTKAFGCCTYIRKKNPDSTYEVKLVAAKSRVAPLKQLTVPRLELQAAVLASRLTKTIRKESTIQFKSVHFFTDSTITLAWIKGPSRAFKPFVSAGIGQIQSDSEPSQWRHIPGEVNVADDRSRGISVQDLKGRWSEGPEFLQLLEELWPQPDTMQAPPEEHPECQRVEAVCQVKISENPIDPQVFSRWRRLIRVTAHIRRLAEKIHLRKHTQVC